jgi:N-acetylated-alpha-linked acidic dipeptidase
VGEVKGLREELAQQAAENNRMHDEGIFAATTNPREPLRPPAREPRVPFVNYAPLDNAVDSLTRAAATWERALGAAMAKLPDAATVARVNAMLRATERTFTSPEGLPRRPWYKHLLYAPGLYTGYGVKTIPGVREATELKDWATVDREVDRLARALNTAAAHIAEMSRLLEGAR